jgi:hypothetical protein
VLNSQINLSHGSAQTHIPDSWGPLHIAIDEHTREAWGLPEAPSESTPEPHSDEESEERSRQQAR